MVMATTEEKMVSSAQQIGPVTRIADHNKSVIQLVCRISHLYSCIEIESVYPVITNQLFKYLSPTCILWCHKCFPMYILLSLSNIGRNNNCLVYYRQPVWQEPSCWDGHAVLLMPVSIL